MNDMPVSVRPALRRLARRLAIGLFLDVWPPWAVASLLLAGLVALVCRMFVARAASSLPWLWLAPLLTALPALVVCFMRAYRPADVVALADWLSGGQGMLLTLLETNDPAWAESPLARARLDVRASATASMAQAGGAASGVGVPGRGVVASPANALTRRTRFSPTTSPPISTATVVELKQQELITPAEEKKLEEEIERIRRGAEERVDASSWEAADALREKVAAGVSEKQDAVKWAEESLARYAAAAQAGANAEREFWRPGRRTDEGARKARAERPARRRAGRPAATAQGRQAADRRRSRCASWRHRCPSTSAKPKGRFGDLAKLGQGVRPVRSVGVSARVRPVIGRMATGIRERGGINRGRADAPLTWGKESSPFDRFKAQALPPGAARSPDDWAPVVELPGAPQESPALERAVGGPAVRRRRRPERVAPHARAAPPERREESTSRSEPIMTGDARALLAPDRVADGQAKIARLVNELRRVILGKEQTIDEVVAALLARGHVLLEGLPGLGKTELVKALSRLLSLDFRRIQFTPDLLPTDITGSHILQERDGRKEFVFHPGPVFTNLLLADEINRASPKTQAALLEAMQERRVTTFGETRPLPRSVLRAGDAESDRARRHLSASRGAARSVHVQGRHRRRRPRRCSRRSSSPASTANRRRSNRC